MECHKYFQFEKGKIKQSEFAEHLRTCTFCQSEVKRDRELLQLSSDLKMPYPDSGEWQGIKTKLESQTAKKKSVSNITSIANSWLKIAAVFIAAALISLSVYYFYPVPENGILDMVSMKKIEQTEQAYINAIEEMEQQALSGLEQMDLNMSLLYREKLQLIDSQIARCQIAVENNPANAHIRRYLLTALKDKKTTLIEIMTVSKSVKS